MPENREAQTRTGGEQGGDAGSLRDLPPGREGAPEQADALRGGATSLPPDERRQIAHDTVKVS